MTKKEAYRYFMQMIYPTVVSAYGRQDRAALRQQWSYYVDTLERGGYITMEQAATWTNPFH